MRRFPTPVVLTVSVLALAACQKPAEEAAKADGADASVAAPAATTLSASATDQEKIESAMRAAPAAVSRDATIVDMAADGSMRELRKGTNGFSCMADNPVTPGPDSMCGDANGMAFIMAWAHKTEPAKNKVGFLYMLEGGTDASNTDPYAAAPTDANNWIKTGPHVMVVGAKGMMEGYPRSPTPDTSKPYVMWPDTPYEHLMIPMG